jgi:hypothetical protein
MWRVTHCILHRLDFTLARKTDMHQPKDKHGRPVTVGARVRLLELSPRFFESLPAEEVEDIRSMIGEVFEVKEVDQYGCVWIEKGWHFPEEGQYIGHSLAPDPHEIELVDENMHAQPA